jgi:uncharacterized protein (TIGR00106 family)
MAVVEISVAPLGTATPGVSAYVAACVELVVKSGLTYQLTSMGTVIEGDIDDVLPLLRAMHEVPFSRGAERVSTLIKIDDRRDRGSHGLQGKIDSVLNKIETDL